MASIIYLITANGHSIIVHPGVVTQLIAPGNWTVERHE